MAIVSFQHNFIFIKTTKTAGTSIEVDLSNVAGEDAIVTPILPPVEGHRPRNFGEANGPKTFFNHMSAVQVRDQIGAERFGRMFKFCVEREPISKCISHYHMLCNSPMHQPPEGAPSWEAYCALRRFPVDTSRYSERRNGRLSLLVDRILRYDRLEQELSAVMTLLGIQGFALRSRAKSEYSRQQRVRPEDVTPPQRAAIERAFAESSRLIGIDWST